MKESLFWLIIIIVIWVVEIKRVEEKKETMVKTLEIKSTITGKTKDLPQTLIELAKKNLGKPYVFATKGPNSFDCSGFVYAMYKQVGITLPRTSLGQSKVKGMKISRMLLKQGDLVFFDIAGKGQVNHSGIYLGEGKFIHASSGKANSVTISNLDGWYKDKFKWGKRLNADK